MVEIAICLAIIAFALVAIIGVLPIGMNAQKENREETLINFDAHYLMDAIRSGSQGADTLTNYIICITNISTVYEVRANPQGGVTISQQGLPVINWYNTSTNSQGQYWQENLLTPHQTTLLTNGFQIIGLLTKPKLEFSANGLVLISNYTTADFRAISGAASDQGYSQSSYDFAFRYRVIPEITPVGVADPSLTNYNPALPTQADVAHSNYFVLATNLQNNLADIRLAFRWPVPPSGSTTNSHGSQVFRTMASGMITNIIINSPTPMVRYFFEPYAYGTIAPTR
jgi:type II secretory pathway pseudopilin PulG